MCAFHEKPSQVLEQLVESSGMPADTVEALASSLAGKGLVFNQPSSSGIMVYRLLPLMLVGVMEYKFMTPLTGSDEERELAELFEKLLSDLKDDMQANYEALIPLFKASPSIDRTVPASGTEAGKGAFSILTNVIYLDLNSESGSITSVDFPASGNEVDVNVDTDVETNLKGLLWSVGAAESTDRNDLQDLSMHQRS